MKIRKARVEDAEEISRLMKGTFRKINSKDYPTWFHLAFNKKNAVNKIKKRIEKQDVFCIIDKNNILGTVYLKEDLIGGLYIKHDHIRKGIGTKLLKFIEDYAKKKGIKKVKLFSTKSAYVFYLKNNYKLIKKGFWTIENFRVGNYIMEKKL